jgi:hypothetical protein
MAWSTKVPDTGVLNGDRGMPHRLLAVSNQFDAQQRVALSANQDAVARAQNGVFCAIGGPGTGKTRSLVENAAARRHTRGVMFVRNQAERQRLSAMLGRRSPGFSSQTLLGYAAQSTRAPFKQQLIHALDPELVINRWGFPLHIAAVAIRTLEIFFDSADEAIDEGHVSGHDQIFAMQASDIYAGLGAARTVWAAMNDGAFPVTREANFKLFAGTEPDLPFDHILVDDAEDLTPAMIRLLEQQRHASVLYAGDPAQTLSAHATIFDRADSDDSTMGVIRLDQSYRLSQSVAQLATRIAGKGVMQRQLVGQPEKHAPIVGLQRAVIGRSDGVLIERAAACAGSGVHWLGGCNALSRLFAVYNQFAGRRDSMADGLVQSFASYDVLKDYATFAGDEDLLSLTRVVDRYRHDTPALAIEIFDNAVPTSKGEQCVEVYATAEQAKGHSWDRVKLADDFDFSGEAADSRDVNHLYLGITRANREVELNAATRNWLNSQV